MLKINKKPCNECPYIEAYKMPYDKRDPRSKDMFNWTLEEYLKDGFARCHKSKHKRVCYGIAKDIELNCRSKTTNK